MSPMTTYVLEIAAYAFVIFAVNMVALEYKKRQRNPRPPIER